jgi:hypothetical protein
LFDFFPESFRGTSLLSFCWKHCDIVDIVWQKNILSGMAIRKPGLIALFDMDGTLTAPRKVPIFFSDSFCLSILFHCFVFMIMVTAA